MRSSPIRLTRVFTVRFKRITATVVLSAGVLVLATGCFNTVPIASFTATPISGIAPLTVSFNASGSSDPDGTIAAYEWTFSDGDHGAGVTVNHVFGSPGIYTVELIVRDDKGATSRANAEIFVAIEVPYDELFRYNESYVGDLIHVRGEIIQVVEKLFGGYTWRVATSESEFFGYIGDIVWVNYSGSRFLEGDIVDLCGEVKGLRTYTAIFGQQVTIPEIDALHVELVE